MLNLFLYIFLSKLLVLNIHQPNHLQFLGYILSYALLLLGVFIFKLQTVIIILTSGLDRSVSIDPFLHRLSEFLYLVFHGVAETIGEVAWALL